MTPPLAFERDVLFGRLVGVTLPDESPRPPLEAFVGLLPAAERDLARRLRLPRRLSWAGGRLALRAALAHLGAAPGAEPLVATPRGAPTLPVGFVGSISHKRVLAVALAARADGAQLGVDLELDQAPRVDISRRVLGAAERTRVARIADPALRAREVLVAFAAKEAIYKAIDPWVQRHVGFAEVEVTREDGALVAAFSARPGEGRFELELVEEPLPGFIVVAARARRAAG